MQGQRLRLNVYCSNNRAFLNITTKKCHHLYSLNLQNSTFSFLHWQNTSLENCNKPTYFTSIVMEIMFEKSPKILKQISINVFMYHTSSFFRLHCVKLKLCKYNSSLSSQYFQMSKVPNQYWVGIRNQMRSGQEFKSTLLKKTIKYHS